MSESAAARDPREPSAGSRLLIDLGPLLVFFATNFLAPVPDVTRIFVATGAFMAAMIAAMIYSQLRYRRISPLVLFSGFMVIILGGLTICGMRCVAERRGVRGRKHMHQPVVQEWINH